MPSLATQPSTVMSSPSVKVFRVHPWRVSALGAPPSHCHGVSVPSGPRASRYTQMCGFRHSTFVTGPLSVIGLLPSNWATNE